MNVPVQVIKKTPKLKKPKRINKNVVPGTISHVNNDKTPEMYMSFKHNATL